MITGPLIPADHVTTNESSSGTCLELEQANSWLNLTEEELRQGQLFGLVWDTSEGFPEGLEECRV